MTEQPLDFRTSVRILKRHPAVVGLITALGIVAGVVCTLVRPPMYASYALVALPAAVPNVTAQGATAHSTAVLAGALPAIRPAISLGTLNNRVDVTAPIADVLSIDVQGATAAQAMDTANAVANSYISYVDNANSPAGKVKARLLERATNPVGTSLWAQMIYTAGIGGMVGLLVGSIGVLAVTRRTRRLRERDEIADAIGVPVLASLPVPHPAQPDEWARLLDDPECSPTDAWRLRTALALLRLSSMTPGEGRSLTVLSFAGDRRALSLGPHLAGFAVSLGIPTTLLVGPLPDAKNAAALRAVCAATRSPANSPGQVQVILADQDAAGRREPGLTVVVATVDARNPRMPGTMRTDTTVLGVSSEAVTADQLARVAASASMDGRGIAGILVADPDPADPTTGRLPNLARPTLMPIRMTGTVVVTRR
jgi:capsular polysaccharide biosynthesis protein